MVDRKRKREVIGDAVVDIKALTKEALERKTKLPNIIVLLELCENGHAATAHKAMAALTHVFVKLIARGDFKRSDDKVLDDVTTWLRAQMDALDTVLCTALSSDEPSLQIAGFDNALLLIRQSSLSLCESDNNWAFANTLFLKVTKACLAANISILLRDHFVSHLNSYADLRLYFLRNLKKLTEELKVPKSAVTASLHKSKKIRSDSQGASDHIYNILSRLRSVGSEAELGGDLWVHYGDGKICKPLDLNSQRKAFSEAWLEFFKLDLSSPVLKQSLLILHNKIIPYLTRPTLLIDFLTDCYDMGGVISLLALNGLFELIKDHNLDYPDFYKKLYALIDDEVLSVKFRSRFFRLLELFLSSSYIPSYLVAAFIKRLARKALKAPTPGVLIVIPLIYNLLRKHTPCIALIHRVDIDPVVATDDRYDPEEDDPAKSKAEESSLWEIVTLMEHYSSTVSGMAKAFKETISKPYNLEDFLDRDFEDMVKQDDDRLESMTPAVASGMRDMSSKNLSLSF